MFTRGYPSPHFPSIRNQLRWSMPWTRSSRSLRLLRGLQTRPVVLPCFWPPGNMAGFSKIPKKMEVYLDVGQNGRPLRGPQMWMSSLVLTIHNFGVPNFDPYPFNGNMFQIWGIFQPLNCEENAQENICDCDVAVEIIWFWFQSLSQNRNGQTVLRLAKSIQSICSFSGHMYIEPYPMDPNTSWEGTKYPPNHTPNTS